MFILAWIIFPIVAAVIADNKKRSAVVWFFLTLILSPLMILLLLALPAINKEVDLGDKKKCPYCAEWIKNEAIVCKHCGRDIG